MVLKFNLEVEMLVVIKDCNGEIASGEIGHDVEIGDTVTVSGRDENGNDIEIEGEVVEIA